MSWNAAASRRCRPWPTANPAPPSPRFSASTTRRWPGGCRRHAAPAGWTPDRNLVPPLTDAHLRRLEALLAKGAKAHGWPNQLWTAARVARLIERHFRIAYHPEHVRKILKRRLGWTSQKPRRQARERNDKEVARWVGDEFPRSVREAWRRKAYLVFLDESGFMLTPTVRRTLAPRGRTPVPSAWGRRDRLSAISCVTLSPVAGRPGLYFDLLDHNVRGDDVVAFLKDVHRRHGPLTVVWDRSQIHSKSKAVKRWLARHPDVVAEDFPGYVPDLNPDEGVWGWAKCGRLANLAADGVGELWDRVIDELIEVKSGPTCCGGSSGRPACPGSRERDDQGGLRGKRMLLTTEDGGETPDVTAADIDRILLADGFGKFAVLSASESSYIQAGNDWQPGVACAAYLRQHGSDPWLLEYRAGESGQQWRATGPVTLDQVRHAFLSYLSGSGAWVGMFEWEAVNV